MSTDRQYRPWRVETRVGKQWVPWSCYRDADNAITRRDRLAQEPNTDARIVNLVSGEVLTGEPCCPICGENHRPPFDGMCLV